MYKKVYVEITNVCNLKCPFCIGNKRPPKYVSLEEFQMILEKLKGHTKYLYLHVLGEPLLHPKINELIDLASRDFYINITTNGYFIEKIKENKKIRQVNISLHSFTENGPMHLEEYLRNIFTVTDTLKEKTFISYRLWVNSKYKEKIVSALEAKYHKRIKGHEKLEENVFIDFDHNFTWPSLENKVISKKGTCYALKDHIAILSDGSVVPCCLDTLGDINLGNIFATTIDEIKMSEKYKTICKGFQENKKTEELCKRCDFIH